MPYSGSENKKRGRTGEEVGSSVAAPLFSSVSPIRQRSECVFFFALPFALSAAGDESAQRHPSVPCLPPAISHTTATVIQFISLCTRRTGEAGPSARWA